jgi:preprotein translocase subunit SecF
MEAAGQSLGQEYIIRAKFEEHIAKASAADDIESKLDRALSVLGGGAERLSIERIGPTVGESLKTKAFWCAFLGCLGILLYIWVRFEFRSGVASLVTQVHDCFVILGVFALLQHEFTLDILAALLTVIGFSINGSIMVLDRIRENLRLRRKLPYGELVNLSINQSLARTLNTAVFVQLAVLPLLFIGPVNVRDFALAMTIGVVVGTYSQICVICPILVDWYYRDHPAARLAAA